MSRFTLKPGKTSNLEQLRNATPARIGVGRAGVRPPTADWILFRRDHALAKDAVKSEFSRQFLAWAAEMGYPTMQTLAADKGDFIAYPPKGKQALPDSIARLQTHCPSHKDVQIVISDGLSATAIEHNITPLMESLLRHLERAGVSSGVPVVVRFGRVRIADQICAALKAKVAINLIGERPGLSASDSLSAYITYSPSPETLSAQRTVLSNIHTMGTKPDEAARQICELVVAILRHRISGVELQNAFSAGG
jgi:ethanolamine ammonia-lyase small subunit